MLIGIATFGLRFDGDSINRVGLGGSETAVVCLAREFARMKHCVHVFCITERPGVYEGVEYHSIADYEEFNKDTGFDVFVCCRFTDILRKPVNAKLKILWCHDMPPDKQRFMAALYQVDKIALLSDFHIQSYVAVMPELKPLIWKTSNGVDMELVKANIRPKVPGKLIYTSRPERGLVYLLRDIFPKLLEHRPDLKLYVCSYDAPVMEVDPGVREAHLECERLIGRLGPSVVRMGSLTKARLYREISSAELWVYPCCFPEISCLAVMEAQACGTSVLTRDEFALIESANSGAVIKVHGEIANPSYIESFCHAAIGMLDRTWCSTN